MLYSTEKLKGEFFEYLKKSFVSKELLLEVIQIGNNLSSTKYIAFKENIAKKLGVKVNVQQFSENNLVVKKAIREFLSTVEKETSKPGLIIQLPVPIDLLDFLDYIPTESDVDMLSNKSYWLWDKGFLPPTIGAIDLVLKDLLIPESNLSKLSMKSKLDFFLDLKGKTVAVIGQGKLVGGPLLEYLKRRQATILAFNQHSIDIQFYTKQAEILISGAGSHDLIDKKWVNPQAILIDAATSEVDGRLVGDIPVDKLWPKNILCPSPGGVGGLTVLYLFYNLNKLTNLSIQNS